MERINILNKIAMLSNEDRKQPLVHNCSFSTFYTNLDLSEPIKIVPYGKTNIISIDKYSQDVASFISWWTNFVLPDLNGFSGFSNVYFDLVNFTIDSK